MNLNIIVLAKQVPDTRNVGKDAMNADGTIPTVKNVKILFLETKNYFLLCLDMIQ